MAGREPDGWPGTAAVLQVLQLLAHHGHVRDGDAPPGVVTAGAVPDHPGAGAAAPVGLVTGRG